MPQGYCENEATPDGFAVAEPTAALTSNAAPLLVGILAAEVDAP